MQAGRSAFFVSVQKRFCFSAFKRQRSWIACLLPQGCPEGLGWTGKNHPRYAPVFFPARPCAKRQFKRPEAYKIGKIIGFLFRALLLIVRIAFIFFIVGLLFF